METDKQGLDKFLMGYKLSSKYLYPFYPPKHYLVKLYKEIQKRKKNGVNNGN